VRLYMSEREKGKLSIHTENILPVIKKWLYSENEIFVRELISNGQDAIEKLRKVSMSEDVFESDKMDFEVSIAINKDKGTIEFTDNGIGMTADEVRKYITQIAFSGAEEFAKQYLQDDKTGSDIIGHFGLGFYSSFIISSHVEIESRSYRLNAEPVFWSSDGGEEFEIGPGTKQDRGTTIRLHVQDDFKEEYSDES